MLFRTLLAVVSLGLALSSAAYGQGDDCSSAAPIQGLGSWTFDNTLLTDSGFVGNTSCTAFTIKRDGFYQWTATSNGDFVVGTPAVAFPVGFLVYAGVGCASNCVDWARSDVIGITPAVLLPGVQAGDSFLFQMGSTGLSSGLITFEVTAFSDPCVAGPDDAFEDNDSCSSPSSVVSGMFTNLVATVLDADFYSVVVPAYHNLVVEWDSTGTGDIDGVVFDSGCNEIAQSPWLIEYTNDSSVAETIVFEIFVDDWYATRNCATYSMDVAVTPNHCLLGTEDLLEDNDTCASAIPLVPGTYTGLWTRAGDEDFFEVVIPPLHSYRVRVIRNELRAGISDVFDGNCSPVGGFSSSGAFGSNTSHLNPMVRIFQVAPGLDGPFANCGGYDLSVDVYPDPCLEFADDNLGGADCASAPSISDGTYVNLAVSGLAPDFFRFCVGDGFTLDLDVLFTHSSGNVNLVLWEGNAGPCNGWNPDARIQSSSSETDNESMSWTNNTGADFEVVLQVTMGGGTVFNCNGYDMVVNGANNCGFASDFCSIPVPNSSGHLTLLDGFKGSTPGSGLHLEARGGPPWEFGYFIVGSGVSGGGVPLGNGFLCFSMLPNDRIGRYNASGTTLNSIGRFDASGRFVGLAGNSTTVFGFDVPGTLPFGGVIASGETWHFQLWHRDAGSSNLSDTMHVTF